MKIKFLNELDFVNYKLPAMFIGWPQCKGKCEGCQNASLRSEPDIEIAPGEIIRRYLENPMSEALVMGGMDPFDTWDDLRDFVYLVRERTNDPIVIYTGYNEDEIQPQIDYLSGFPNIIVKFGRYIPGQEKHFDPVLGVELASQNQYARQLSC